MPRRRLALVALPLALAVTLTGCGAASDDAATGGGSSSGPTIVVTTGILGDVVTELVGDAAAVEVLMGPGVDPHDFQLSAQQAAGLREADALISNGAGFEEGMVEAIESAEADGVAIHEAISGVETLEAGAHDHAEEEGAEHADEEGGEHADEEGGADPHFFTDPDRMAVAAAGIVEFLVAEVPTLDAAAVEASADAYLAELEALGAAVDEILAPIAPDARIMVTNHEVFGYFADRFAFEVVGVIVPGGGTQGEADARQLAELAEVVTAEGVQAIFADVSSPQTLADTLAAEAGGEVEVVALFTESLGEEGSGGETYLAMVRTNAERIAAALA